jgi:hypothetical protein
MIETCHVANAECDQPANLARQCLRPMRTKCFVCGLPVCKKCSRLRHVATYGRRRVCDNCNEDASK